MRKINNQIEDYLKYCAEVRKMSETTLKSKRYVLERFSRETNLKNLKQLTNQTFNTYITKMTKNKISGSSINTYSATILVFVKYYKNLNLKIPFNDMLIKKQKEFRTVRKYYTENEIEKVLAISDLETKLMIKIMFETGMRIAELTKLKISDFLDRKITFIGKGSKKREVYIKESTRGLLDNYLKKFSPKDYLWGMTLTGEPPTEHTIRKKLKKIFLDAGFPDFYPHALRHSFATNLQIKGATVAEIKEMMGHSSIATTEKYLHGFSGRLAELFEKYS